MPAIKRPTSHQQHDQQLVQSSWSFHVAGKACAVSTVHAERPNRNVKLRRNRLCVASGIDAENACLFNVCPGPFVAQASHGGCIGKLARWVKVLCDVQVGNVGSVIQNSQKLDNPSSLLRVLRLFPYSTTPSSSAQDSCTCSFQGNGNQIYCAVWARGVQYLCDTGWWDSKPWRFHHHACLRFFYHMQ
jgi:hypothetical protein